MTNKRQCYLLKLNNKNCQNIKRLPHFFYILKVIYTFILVYLYFYATILIKQYLIPFYTHLLQIIRLFWIFIYHLSSLVHNATLKFLHDDDDDNDNDVAITLARLILRNRRAKNNSLFSNNHMLQHGRW